MINADARAEEIPTAADGSPERAEQMQLYATLFKAACKQNRDECCVTITVCLHTTNTFKIYNSAFTHIPFQ